MFVIMATERGPSVVEHGIISIGCAFVAQDNPNVTSLKINIKPFKAQVDNVKQPLALTESPLEPIEAMRMLDDLLTKNKDRDLFILGDVTGINYYLNLCELPGIFKRSFKSYTCLLDGAYLNTKDKLPDELVRRFVEEKTLLKV
jgi:hypothetical protein